MICEECVSCPIKDLCDMVDKIIDDNMSLDGEHDLLMAIYEKGRADAIDDAERELLANGFIFTEHALEVWHNIAEQLKEQKHE